MTSPLCRYVASVNQALFSEVFWTFVCSFHGRHDELVTEGGVYANMWLHQQQAEEKDKHGGITDSGEEDRDEDGSGS